MKFNRLVSGQTWANFVLLNAIDISNNGPMFCSTNSMVRIISFVICFYRKEKRGRIHHLTALILIARVWQSNLLCLAQAKELTHPHKCLRMCRDPKNYWSCITVREKRKSFPIGYLIWQLRLKYMKVYIVLNSLLFLYIGGRSCRHTLLV